MAIAPSSPSFRRTGAAWRRVGPLSAEARKREAAKARRPLVGMLYGTILAVPLWALILKAVGLY